MDGGREGGGRVERVRRDITMMVYITVYSVNVLFQT